MSRIIDFCYDYILLLACRANWYATRHSTRFMKGHFKDKLVVGAEIGTQRGANAVNMLQILNIKQLYLIDPYKNYDGIDGLNKLPFDEVLKIAKHGLRKYKDKITFIRKMSEDAVDDIPNLDFLYIDGNHNYEYVKKDIELYYPKIKKGGVLGGHDFDIPDIAHAVTEFASKNNLKVFRGGHPVDWWVVWRTIK